MKKSFLAGTIFFLGVAFLGGCMAQHERPGVRENSLPGRTVPEGAVVRCEPLPPENLKTCYIFKDGVPVDRGVTSGSF